MAREPKTLIGFLKYLLTAIGDPQLAFATYVDTDPQGGVDLADALREQGIDIQKLNPEKTGFRADHEEEKPSPRAYWQVPEGEESTSKLVGQ